MINWSILSEMAELGEGFQTSMEEVVNKKNKINHQIELKNQEKSKLEEEKTKIEEKLSTVECSLKSLKSEMLGCEQVGWL